MIRTLLKPLSFIPAILMMYAIFTFSSQSGDVSAQLSYKVSYKIVETVDYVFDGNLEDWQIDEWANKINFITRKLAHMAEYFALAVAVSFPLYVYGLHGLLLMLVAGLICVGFACGDEYHQAFVAGRGPSVKDVCIDSVGVFFGIILVRIIGWTGRKTIFKQKKPKVKKIKNKKYYYDNEPYYDGPSYSNGPYQAPPYGGYQQPDPNYKGRQQRPGAPHRQQGEYRPYDDGVYDDYSEPPYGPENYQQPPYPYPEDPRNMNDRNLRSADLHQEDHNGNYDDDWGMNSGDENNDSYWAPRPDYPNRPHPPQGYEHPNSIPPKEKKTKKEKDWFFDV